MAVSEVRQIDNLPSPRVALASSSPQRIQLLGQIIAPDKIEQLPSGHDEQPRPGERPPERVSRLALEKAEMVLAADQFGPDVEFIVGADTEIAIESDGHLEEVPHPGTLDEAIDTLERLAGREHVALTGVAVIGRDPSDYTKIKRVSARVTTAIEFRALTRTEISAYAQTEEPLGRAGGYAIQGQGGNLVRRIDGSYSNVVGLPLERLLSMFSEDFEHPLSETDPDSGWSTRRPLRGRAA